MRLPHLRLTTGRMMLALAALAVVLGAIRLVRDGYYAGRNRILAQLAGVEGITGVEVAGSDDITFEVHCVRFEIAGRPDAVIEIEIDDPEAGVVGGPEHLRLRRLGPWEFHQVAHGYQGVYTTATSMPARSIATRASVDVGSLGELGAMLPVKVRGVNDLVAHYDELVRHLAAWPDEKTWGMVDEPTGRRLAYCRVDARRRGPIPAPPQFSRAW